MTNKPRSGLKAYRNQPFLDSRDARSLRILAESLEPASRFAYHDVKDTIVFMGSARTPSRCFACPAGPDRCARS